MVRGDTEDSIFDCQFDKDRCWLKYITIKSFLTCFSVIDDDQVSKLELV